MESTTMNPPVKAESRVKSEIESIIFPVFVVTEQSWEEEAKAFKRRLWDAKRRFDQARVCGKSILVAKISYELDALKLEAKEKGFEF